MYVRILKELSNYYRITLVWIPGHAGCQGKEKADEVARTGSTKAFIDPEPFRGNARKQVENTIKEWVEKES